MLKNIMNGLVAISLLLSGCDTTHQERGISVDGGELHDLDGEGLYAGLFFGLGPAATLLPEVHSVSGQDMQSAPEVVSALGKAAQRLSDCEDGESAEGICQAPQEGKIGQAPLVDLSHRQLVARAIITQIKAGEPEFFAEFERQIRSGDPVQVDSAMSRAAERTAAARERIAGSSGHQELKQQSGLFLAAAAVLALVVAIWSGVVIVEGLWVAAGSASGQEFDDGSLLRDELVARITESAQL